LRKSAFPKVGRGKKLVGGREDGDELTLFPVNAGLRDAKLAHDGGGWCLETSQAHASRAPRCLSCDGSGIASRSFNGHDARGGSGDGPRRRARGDEPREPQGHQGRGRTRVLAGASTLNVRACECTPQAVRVAVSAPRDGGAPVGTRLLDRVVVAAMVALGAFPSFPEDQLRAWNWAVVLNVLGAGLSRLGASVSQGA
jgi:hypothetical protein